MFLEDTTQPQPHKKSKARYNIFVPISHPILEIHKLIERRRSILLYTLTSEPTLVTVASSERQATE